MCVLRSAAAGTATVHVLLITNCFEAQSTSYECAQRHVAGRVKHKCKWAVCSTGLKSESCMTYKMPYQYCSAALNFSI